MGYKACKCRQNIPPGKINREKMLRPDWRITKLFLSLRSAWVRCGSAKCKQACFYAHLSLSLSPQRRRPCGRADGSVAQLERATAF